MTTIVSQLADGVSLKTELDSGEIKRQDLSCGNVHVELVDSVSPNQLREAASVIESAALESTDLRLSTHEETVKYIKQTKEFLVAHPVFGNKPVSPSVSSVFQLAEMMANRDSITLYVEAAERHNTSPCDHEDYEEDYEEDYSCCEDENDYYEAF